MSKGVPVAPRRVFGVDFSGARRAGRKIWICRGHPGEAGVRVESVDPLHRLPGGAARRDDALRALVQKVLEAPRSAWGFDFPFALPKGAVPDECASFDDQLEWVASIPDAETLRRLCRSRADGRELRRPADEEAATPMSPYNLRLFRQTYHGMVGVLGPLRSQRAVAMLPMDVLPAAGPEGAGRLPHNVRAPRSGAHTYLLETCPASLLVELQLDPRGYKGAGRERVERRLGILRALIDRRLVRPMPRALRRTIGEDRDGDALDAVLCAVGAWRGCRDHDHGALRADPAYRDQGYVYR